MPETIEEVFDKTALPDWILGSNGRQQLEVAAAHRKQQTPVSVLAWEGTVVGGYLTTFKPPESVGKFWTVAPEPAGRWEDHQEEEATLPYRLNENRDRRWGPDKIPYKKDEFGTSGGNRKERESHYELRRRFRGRHHWKTRQLTAEAADQVRKAFVAGSLVQHEDFLELTRLDPINEMLQQFSAQFGSGNFSPHTSWTLQYSREPFNNYLSIDQAAEHIVKKAKFTIDWDNLGSDEDYVHGGIHIRDDLGHSYTATEFARRQHFPNRKRYEIVQRATLEHIAYFGDGLIAGQQVDIPLASIENVPYTSDKMKHVPTRRTKITLTNFDSDLIHRKLVEVFGEVDYREGRRRKKPIRSGYQKPHEVPMNHPPSHGPNYDRKVGDTTPLPHVPPPIKVASFVSANITVLANDRRYLTNNPLRLPR